MGDRRGGFTDALGEELEELAQPFVVELARGLDDDRRRFAMGWFENLRKVLRKMGWQVVHHGGVYGHIYLESKGYAADRDRGRDLGTEPRRDRQEPAQAVHGPARHRDISRAAEACGRGHRMVLG